MAKKVTLEQLERLCAAGKDDELQLALRQSRFEDLRAFLVALGVKVRTRAYAAYRSKEDHVKLLTEVLQGKIAGNDAPIVPTKVTPVKRSADEGAGNGLVLSREETPRQPLSLTPLSPPSPQLQQQQVKRNGVDRVGGFLVAGAPMSTKDAERAYLVQCINIVDDAVTNVERKMERVSGLKRTLTCELAYYVKRLKRIQEMDEGGNA